MAMPGWLQEQVETARRLLGKTYDPEVNFSQVATDFEEAFGEGSFLAAIRQDLAKRARMRLGMNRFTADDAGVCRQMDEVALQAFLTDPVRWGYGQNPVVKVDPETWFLVRLHPSPMAFTSNVYLLEGTRACFIEVFTPNGPAPSGTFGLAEHKVVVGLAKERLGYTGMGHLHVKLVDPRSPVLDRKDVMKFTVEVLQFPDAYLTHLDGLAAANIQYVDVPMDGSLATPVPMARATFKFKRRPASPRSRPPNIDTIVVQGSYSPAPGCNPFPVDFVDPGNIDLGDPSYVLNVAQSETLIKAW